MMKKVKKLRADTIARLVAMKHFEFEILNAFVQDFDYNHDERVTFEYTKHNDGTTHIDVEFTLRTREAIIKHIGKYKTENEVYTAGENENTILCLEFDFGHTTSVYLTDRKNGENMFCYN